MEDEEMEDDILDEFLEEQEESDNGLPRLDIQNLSKEIRELEELVRWARSIGRETKRTALLQALDVGFQSMRDMGAAKKALIFTESRRTQEALKHFLEANGYAGK
ncbi:hypothetical protein RZS08_41010, partial [Arthrospira platensis SPKY1]|nr:hypothetical protein [Arthrospira platensis SPKY1]